MPTYEPSGKHCEPITAHKPGLKCPPFSAQIAQHLLDESLPMGSKRVATREGIAFVAQCHDELRDRWHGYPEAWDKIDWPIKKHWLDSGKVERRHLRTYASREQIRSIFGGSLP